MRVLPFLVLAACSASDAAAQFPLGPVGASAGVPFRDACGPAGIAGVAVRAGRRVDGLQLLCRTVAGGIEALPYRGGAGGSLHLFTLEPGERIVAYIGHAVSEDRAEVSWLRLVTTRRYSPVWGDTSRNRLDNFWIPVPGGMATVGLIGSASGHLHGIGLLINSYDEAPVGGYSGSLGGLTVMPLPPDADSAGRCPRRGGPCADASGVSWLSAAGGAIPDGAMTAGREAVDGIALPVYACRAYVTAESQVGPGTIPGLVSPAARGCKAAVPGETGALLLAREYEVLAALPGRWAPADSGRVPPGRVVLGSVGEEEYAACRPLDGAEDAPLGLVSEGTGGCLVIGGQTPRVSPRFEVLVR